MEDLNAASLEDVSQFFATFYAPNNAVLTVAGDFEPASALAMIERHFGPIPANAELPARLEVTLDPFLLGTEVRDVVLNPAPLPRVYLAYRIPSFGSERFDALEVTGDLLAAGRASRLYATLVRERQVAQDVIAFPFTLVEEAAILAIWATAGPAIESAHLESALLTEIDRLADSGPGDDELMRVRNLHSATTASALERIAERADRLSQYACFFDEPERINTEDSRYQAVTAEQVQAAMASVMRPDNRVVLTYLPGGGT
jgi:predicted Zn-dependent peptidase